MKATIVNFSTRNHDGNCKNIAKYISSKLIDQVHFEIIELLNANISACGHCEYSCLDPNKYECDTLDDTLDIYKKIGDSDVSFFIIPIYSDYPCANYFIFREKSQSLINKGLDNYSKVAKHFIFIANTGYDNLSGIVSTEPMLIKVLD